MTNKFTGMTYTDDMNKTQDQATLNTYIETRARIQAQCDKGSQIPQGGIQECHYTTSKNQSTYRKKPTRHNTA